MSAVTVVAGSTGYASIVPVVDPAYPTVDSVAFEWAESDGTALDAPTVTDATVDDVTTYSAVLPHGPTAGHAGEEWSGAFTIVRSGDDGEQTSTVALRVFVVATSLPVNYSDYVDAGFSSIPFADWPRYLAWADRVLAQVTMGRDLTDADYADYADQIAAARLAIADAAFANETGIISESLGSYSYTLASPRVGYSPARVGIAALSGTGLCYRGV